MTIFSSFFWTKRVVEEFVYFLDIIQSFFFDTKIQDNVSLELKLNGAKLQKCNICVRFKCEEELILAFVGNWNLFYFSSLSKF